MCQAKGKLKLARLSLDLCSANLVPLVLFGMFGVGKFGVKIGLIGLVWQIWSGRFGLVGLVWFFWFGEGKP